MPIKLSPNFNLIELTKSSTAMRMGIDNTPSDLTHLVNLTHLAIHILQPCRDEFGVITVNSGYRSPDLNKAVGGSDRSQHCHGQAADFESFKKKLSIYTGYYDKWPRNYRYGYKCIKNRCL